MTEPYLGEIRMFGGDFAPRGWTRCDGQLLAIADHAPLYSLLGTTYGGDGVETFALPDLPGSMLHPQASPSPQQRERSLPIVFMIALAGIFPIRP